MAGVIKIIATILLLAVIAYSFMFIGSPQHNRQMLEDIATLAELRKLDCALNLYSGKEKELPKDIDELLKHKSQFQATRQYCVNWCDFNDNANFKDSKTGQYYEYTPKGSSYSVYANFNFDWKELEKNHYTNNEDFKNYNQGHFCFTKEISECKNRK